MFIIDSQNFLRNIEPFDREADYFADYLIPQIQIKLELICDPTAMVTKANQLIRGFSENLVTDEILFSRTVTYLNIIIVDQNDNAPIFIYPATNNYYTGQLDKELTEKIMSHDLIKIDAFDLDDGENAEIKYALESNEHFTIDPESGTIYPLRNSMSHESSVQLVVTATDRNGAENGLSTTVTIFVENIRMRNVVVLTFDNEAFDDVEEAIEIISKTAEIDLRIINYFAVPQSNESESKQLESDKAPIYVFAYGFFINNTLMTSYDILEILQSQQAINIETFLNYYDKTMRSSSDCNLTGWIVAVSVLGSLILVLAISAPFIWMFWLRYRFTARRESQISAKKFEDDFSDGTNGRTSPIVIASSDIYESPMTDAEIIGIVIDGATQGRIAEILSKFFTLFTLIQQKAHQMEILIT